MKISALVNSFDTVNMHFYVVSSAIRFARFVVVYFLWQQQNAHIYFRLDNPQKHVYQFQELSA